MITRISRKGAATASALLCMTLPAAFLAFHTGCATNPSEYKNPAPAISLFLVSKTNDFAAKATSVEISSGQSAWIRANFAVKNGTAVVMPGNHAVLSNVPLEIPNITATTPYTLTVTSGDGQKATSAVTVNVSAAPSNLTYANEDATYYVGVQIPSNAPTVSGAAPIDYFITPSTTPLPNGLTLNPTTGTITGTPQVTSAQTTYSITAHNSVGTTTRNIKIAVAATPIALSVNPSSITVGAGATLSWDANSVAGIFNGVTITSVPPDASLPTTFGLSGTANVSPVVTTTYTLSATPTAGGPAVIKSVDLTVGAAPVHFTSLTAAPALPLMGTSCTLSWTFTGTPLALTLDGVDVLGSFNKNVTPIRRQTYTLAGSNSVGSDSRTIAVPAIGFDLLAGVPSSQGTYDGKGTSIRFVSPGAMAADAAGNVYWVDVYGQTVRMMTPDGQAKTIAGTPGLTGNTDTSLNAPRGIVVTPDGNTIFVGDSGNCVIKKLVKDVASPTGYTMTTFTGQVGSASGVDGPKGTCTFGSPSGLAFDPTGNYILVADYLRNAVRQVSVADGSTITYAGNANGAGAALVGKADVANASLAGATFSKINGIAFNKAGTAFYVSDGGNFNIRMVTWSGAATSGTPTGSTYTVAGTGISGIVDGAQGTGSLSACYAMAVDASDAVYIADYTNGLVRKMTVAANAGTLSTVAGSTKDLSKDGVGNTAAFNKVTGLLLTNGGSTLLASDLGGSGCIRSIDLATATVTTPYGVYKNAGFVNGTGAGATFNGPIGVATDAQNNVYVSDTKNHLIRKITPAGVTTTIAGTAGVLGTADGTGILASFSSPQGIAVDATGNLYVADTGNKKIRMIDTAGVVTTLATLTNAPTGIAVDPTKAGRIFVVTTGASILPIDGTTVGAAITATPAFNFPATFAGIVVDASGNLYVADRSNHAIRKVTSPLGTPVVTTVAGIIGTPGMLNGALGTNTLTQPAGLGMDADGNLFITEGTSTLTSKPMIRRIDTAGNVTIVVASANLAAGTTTAPGSAPGVLPATITGPQSLAVNAQGDILVTTLDAVMQVTAPAGK